MIDKKAFKRACAMNKGLLTNKEIAEYLGMSEATLSCKINGKRPMTIAEAELWCKKLGIRTDSDKGSIFLTD